MQDKYYSTPLHGVECLLPDVKPNSSQVNSAELSVELEFAKVASCAELEPIWTLKDQGQRYLTELNLYPYICTDQEQHETPNTSDKAYVLAVNCEGKGRFLIQQNKITIDWEAGTPSSHYFQTLALALWLEIKQIPCIHANALKRDKKTFALVAASGTGKSTLSAKLQQLGCAWLTDDMLALHQDGAKNASKSSFQVYPSWPIARMWPDSVENVLGQQESVLNKVHARFNKRLIELQELSDENKYFSELSVIYILNRTVTDGVHNSPACKIETINSSQALILLLQNSILGNAYSALELEFNRIRQLSILVQSTKIKKITYSSGKENLDFVSKAIFEDLNKP